VLEAVWEELSQRTDRKPTSAGFERSLVDRYRNLWRDHSADGRAALLSLAFRQRDPDATAERKVGIERAQKVAKSMLDASLVLADPRSPVAEVKKALVMIDEASVSLEHVESRTLAQAELISAIHTAAAWIRAGYPADDAVTGAREWFERNWPAYVCNDGGLAFQRAVEAWRGRGGRRRWDATGEALRAAGIRTSATNARKLWQRRRPAGRP